MLMSNPDVYAQRGWRKYGGYKLSGVARAFPSEWTLSLGR